MEINDTIVNKVYDYIMLKTLETQNEIFDVRDKLKDTVDGSEVNRLLDKFLELQKKEAILVDICAEVMLILNEHFEEE